MSYKVALVQSTAYMQAPVPSHEHDWQTTQPTLWAQKTIQCCINVVNWLINVDQLVANVDLMLNRFL